MNRVVLFVAALGVFVLDRLSKLVIEATLPLHHSVSLIPGVLDFFHTRNTGVAFGLLSGSESSWVPHLLTLVSAVALGVILTFSLRHPAGHRRLQWGLMLVFGGAAGNLYDRIRYGYVIDFIEAYFKGYHWPTFNAADACITTGIGLLMVEILSQKGGIEEGRMLAADDSNGS